MSVIALIFSKYKKSFVIMLLLTVLSGFLGVGILAYINSQLLNANNPKNIAVLFIFALLVVAYLAIATWSQIKLSRIGHQFIYEMQAQLLKRIMDSHEAQIQLSTKPKILASLSSDIRVMSYGFTRLPELVQGVLFVTACSVYMIYISPSLFMVTAILLALMIVVTNLLVKRHYKNFHLMRVSEDQLYKHYETSLEGHKELSLNRYRAERFYHQDFLSQAQAKRDHHVQADAYHVFAVNWSNSVMLGVVGVIFYLAVYLGWASLKDATTVTMTVFFLRTPLTAAIGAFPVLLQSQVAYSALHDLGLTPYKEAFHDEHKVNADWQEIRLENVTYSYPVQGGQHFALQPVNLTLTKGETVFLIGSNGSGKSTLSMVLAGLYEPASGKIYVDDIEITAENRRSYQQIFSSVFTDFYLFDQIMDGFADQVSDELIATWLDHLQLDEKVKIENYRILNTKLSQGQRKRLALFLAALENRSLLILDEWAADQDPYYRRVFYEQILPILKAQGFTVFAISHDDKYFSHAQRIISMSNGELSEHDALAAIAVADAHSRET